MPAQKLTRPRLIQILIMMALLLVAFFWRTATHKAPAVIECQQSSICVIHLHQQRLRIQQQADGEVKITGLPNQWKIVDPITNKATQTSASNQPIFVAPKPELTLVTHEGEEYTLRFVP